MREAAGPWGVAQGCPKAKPPRSLCVMVGLGPKLLSRSQGQLQERFVGEAATQTGREAARGLIRGKIKAEYMLMGGLGEGRQLPRQPGRSCCGSLGCSLHAGMCRAAEPPDLLSLPATPRIDAPRSSPANLLPVH